MNASGKKVYDREFMLSVREACTDRPAGLTADLKIEGGVAMEPKGGGRGGGQGPPGVDQWRTAGGGRGGGRGGLPTAAASTRAPARATTASAGRCRSRATSAAASGT